MTNAEIIRQQAIWSAYHCLRQSFDRDRTADLAEATAEMYEWLMLEAEPRDIAMRHVGELRRELAALVKPKHFR